MRLLLDEHFSEQDAAEVSRHDPPIDIVSLHAWEGGAYLAHDDAAILAEAYRQGRTLVTRDMRTIPPLLVLLAQAGTSHGGVIFVDHRLHQIDQQERPCGVDLTAPFSVVHAAQAG